MDQRQPQPEVPNQDFGLLHEYTPCGKNHTYHSESWPSSGEIVIEKCERQCRFRDCKAWSQTAAALRKHVNKHIQHNSLPLKIVPASSGRAPLKIIIMQGYGGASCDSLDSLANAAAQDSQLFQQTVESTRPLSPFQTLDSGGRMIQRDGNEKQHATMDNSTSTHNESIHDFHLFDSGPMIHLQNDPGYDTMRVSMHGTIDESHAFGSDVTPSKEVPTQPSLRDLWAASTMACPTATPRVFGCPDCKMIFKTELEQKKHIAWHGNCFRCHHPACNRKIDGFNTLKNLERHMKAMHPSAPTVKYRCCMPECKSKEKRWPREDNFRSHLKRVHSGEISEKDYRAVLSRCRVVCGEGTMPGNGTDLHPLHVLADSAASAR